MGSLPCDTTGTRRNTQSYQSDRCHTKRGRVPITGKREIGASVAAERDQARAWCTFTFRCVGCEGRSSHWSPTGVRAVHTASGPGGRRRKGLEPSRRLSETTGPRSPSAFRVVVPVTEVTKCGARCKRTAAFFTHRAPEPVAGRLVTLAHECFPTCSSEQPGAAHMFPQRRDGRCKRRCSRRRLSVHSLPRARERKVHTLPRRQPREARCRTRRRSRPHGSRRSCRHDRGRSCGCRCAAKPAPET